MIQTSKDLLWGVVGITVFGASVEVYFSGGASASFDKNKYVSGASFGNLQYAKVAPELFDFYIIDECTLHIVCPYTQPHTQTLGVYLIRVSNGDIVI